MIETKELTKSFGSKRAVDGISFYISRGEIVGFVGPNGAGKTTTMRILTCFFPATSGVAKVAGFDVFDNPMEVKRKIGYLPEHPPLYHEMTVKSFLKFIAEVKEVPRQKRKAKVEEIMRQVEIGDVENQPIGTLSKGYQQRVGLAQALLHDPEVLILDEPTVGLDPRQNRGFRELIKGLAGTRTIILSTHILPEVSSTCRRVIVIDKGKIVGDGTQEELIRKTLGKTKYRVVSSNKEVDGVALLSSIRGVTQVIPENHGEPAFIVESSPDADIREEIFKVAYEKGWILKEVALLEGTLEEVFLALTGLSESEEERRTA